MIYAKDISLGWGVVGTITSGIRNEARRANVTLDPFPRAKLHELVQRIPIRAEGTEDNIAQFSNYMNTILSDAEIIN